MHFTININSFSVFFICFCTVKSCNFIPNTSAQLKSLEGKFLNKMESYRFPTDNDRSHHLEDQSF